MKFSTAEFSINGNFPIIYTEIIAIHHGIQSVMRKVLTNFANNVIISTDSKEVVDKVNRYTR